MRIGADYIGARIASMTTNGVWIRFENPAIDGASTTPGHEKEIEVLSWGAAVAPDKQPRIVFTKYLDTATNAIMKMCWSGKQIEKAVLRCFRYDKGAPHEYLVITMEHVVIENYSVSGGPGEIPVENVSLIYGTVHYDYRPQSGALGMMATFKQTDSKVL